MRVSTVEEAQTRLGKEVNLPERYDQLSAFNSIKNARMFLSAVPSALVEVRLRLLSRT